MRNTISLTTVAPRQSLDPRQQFGESERLDQIVVAAAAQAAHGADDQSRRINAGVTDLPDDGKTIHAGKHAIDRHHGITGGKSKTQPVVAVERQIDVITARAEEIDKLPSRLRIVLNDQDAAPRSRHRPLSPTKSAKVLAQTVGRKTDFCVRNCRISSLPAALQLGAGKWARRIRYRTRVQIRDSAARAGPVFVVFRRARTVKTTGIVRELKD
jgi:hypothetical protein